MMPEAMKSLEIPPAGRPARFPALDGVRGVAILLVLFHQLSRVGTPDLAARVVEYALDFGWVGVQLFFVLSGFLITGILLDSRGAPGYLRSFFVRRVLRVFPLYFGALVLVLGILPETGLVPRSWREDQLWYWLFLSNWFQPFNEGKLPHLWSLAVEEQFYLAWPFVVLGLSAAPLLRLCLFLSAAAFAGRCAMVAGGLSPEAIYMFTPSRVDALLLGAAGAACLRLPGGIPAWITARRLWAFALGAGAAGFLASRGFQRTGALGQTVGYAVLAAVFAGILLALVREQEESPRPSRVARVLGSAPMRALGKYSFGMYVFHKPLHDLVGKPALAALGLGGPLAVAPGLAYAAIGIAVVTAAGGLSYHLFERHFLALKPRFGPGQPAAPVGRKGLF